MELIKEVVKVGNSAGVLLPRKYLNSRARVILNEPRERIEEDIIRILIKNGLLGSVLGIYLVGSYAREEENVYSDVDILVASIDKDLKIDEGKYEIVVISLKTLESVRDNALPLLPMLNEAETIMNKKLLDEYSKIELNEKNLSWHFVGTKSAMEINKTLLSESIVDVYSLVLRLREVYIVDCLISGKKLSNKYFLKLAEKLTGFKCETLHELRNKKIDKQSALKIIDYVEERLENQRRWVKRKNRRKE